MHVLTLTPGQAADYYDTYQERSFRKISLVLWTLNGEPEPPNYSAHEENEAWLEKQDIKVIEREDLDGLELAENQELRLDAAVWLIRTPTPKKPAGLALFTHEMREEPLPFPDGEFFKPYDLSLLFYFQNGEEIDALTSALKVDRVAVYGEHNPGVVESSSDSPA